MCSTRVKFDLTSVPRICLSSRSILARRQKEHKPYQQLQKPVSCVSDPFEYNLSSSSPTSSNLASNESAEEFICKHELSEDLRKAVELMPERFRSRIFSHPDYTDLLELIMDFGRKPLARFPNGDFILADSIVDFNDLKDTIGKIGEFGDDNRAGLEGTLHRISCMRDRDDRIYALTIRVGRSVVSQTADLVKEYLCEGKSILLLGPPGVGKTTAVRNFCRMLSDDFHKIVVIVDTSNEIAGFGLLPHPSVGTSRRMIVKHRRDQHKTMVEAVQNHMPQVVIVDEIGDMMECKAVRSISQRGVQLVATTHARTLEQVTNDPELRNLVGGISSVTIGDQRAYELERDRKTVPERAFNSSFDIVVEMAERTKWRIHSDANAAVDAILAGVSAEAELRYLDENGKMITSKENSERPLRNDARHYAQYGQRFYENEEYPPESTNGLEQVSEAPKIDLQNDHEINGEMHEADGSIQSKALKEAQRILATSSDWEKLKAKPSCATKEKLRESYKRVYTKIEKASNEDESVKKARSSLLLAYARLRKAHF